MAEGRGTIILLVLLLIPLGTAGALAQEITLHVMIHPPFFEAWSTLQEVAADFEREHGVRVHVLSSSGSASEADKIKFHLLSGLPLDVTWIDVTEFGAFLREDVLADLQPYFDEDAQRGAWDPDAYFARPRDALTDERGHLYGLPSTFTPYVMYINRDLLAAEGLEAPAPDWTWDDLLVIARRCTRDSDGDGRTDIWGISLTQWLQALVPWIWQNGGDLLTPDGERSALDSPEVIEALAFLKRLLHEEKVASFDGTFEDQFRQGLFQAGRVGLYGPVGYWETYRFKHITAFRWDVVPLPSRKTAATSVAMRSYVVPRVSQHPRLAYAFVRALAGEKMQRALARIGNGVPGLKAAAYSEDFLKPDVAPDSEHVFLDVIERGEARFMPRLANWREIEDVIGAELQGALILDKYTAAEACRRMAQKIDAFLERERARDDLPSLSPAVLPVSVLGSIACAVLAFVWSLRRVRSDLARREARSAVGFLTLWGLGFLTLVLGSMVASFVLGLAEWSPLRSPDDLRWVGLGNFSRLFEDDTFGDSLRVTLLYTVVSVPATLVFALGIAMLLDRPFRGVNLARTVIYLPALVSPVVVAAVWKWLLDSERGALNAALWWLGIEGPPWLSSETWVLPAFVLMGLWQVGAQTLVFLAGLQGQDRTLLDAARMDGASAWRRFWHVTLPGLGPVVLFNVVMGTITAFQIFAQPFVMTQGEPGNASRFLSLYIYETAFHHLAMGYASAIAWVMFIVLFVLTLLTLAFGKRFVHYAGGR